ncbi:VOC family protein [Humibacter sp. RRB41]|uniref:VOC family protein n=1 Tax=Humibacter sp. RRB41 TaxID=2919946 RepID=UPI001FAA577F|nr:VOC family protein [Humibacter sp. RRB41]
MANTVVHAEIIGEDPDALRAFYSALFGWDAVAGDSVAPAVSGVDLYSFNPSTNEAGVPVGIGGGAGFTSRVLFYVGVNDVDAALRHAVELGGTVVIEATNRPDNQARVAQFADPAGNIIGIAGSVIR